MSEYQYTARDRNGRKTRGRFEGASTAEVAHQLKAKGLHPISIRRRSLRTGLSPFGQDVVRFFEDLKELLGSGMTMDRALSLLADTSGTASWKNVVADLAEQVNKGADLSEALERHGKTFGRLAPRLIRAGEAGGNLIETMGRTAEYLKRQREFRKSVVSAMTYPAILLVMSFVSLIILLTYVVPQFADVFLDFNQAVPPMTRLFIGLGELLNNWGWMLPVLMGLGYVGWRMALRKPSLRLGIDKALLTVKGLRGLLLCNELGRYCLTLGTLLKGGVPVVQGLALCEDVVRNSSLRLDIEGLQGHVKSGGGISGYFLERDVFPPRLGAMLLVAEESGRLAQGLLQMGEHFEQEFHAALKKCVQLIEPATIIVSGVFIGLLVMSMFTAILSLGDIGL